jgi:hypothetical protein
MIIHNILHFDFHIKKKDSVLPLITESPAQESYFPAVISNTRGEFLVIKKIGKDKVIRSGIFPYDSDKIDDLIPNLFKCAFDLSIEQKWDNVFSDSDSAFKFIQSSSGLKIQPHVCLIPDSWDMKKIEKFFKKDKLEINDSKIKYNKICSINKCKILSPVFLSRPDFVGMYTQFMGGLSSIVLHNIKLGIAFVK